jgi:glutamyl-Q tRNA(Asp) synthetase
MIKAWDYIGREFLTFCEAEKVLKSTPEIQIVTRNEAIDNIGDVVLSRPGSEASYHLSVVIDDAELGINNIVRGEDLFDATKIHTILYFLFNFPKPIYYHHRLITDSNGKRLATRDRSQSISSLRKAGLTPKSISSMLGI